MADGATILCLDDDHLRRRRANDMECGLSVKDNKRKAFGSINHGVVSAATGLVLTTHVGLCGETENDMIPVLLGGVY